MKSYSDYRPSYSFRFTAMANNKSPSAPSSWYSRSSFIWESRSSLSNASWKDGFLQNSTFSTAITVRWRWRISRKKPHRKNYISSSWRMEKSNRLHRNTQRRNCRNWRPTLSPYWTYGVQNWTGPQFKLRFRIYRRNLKRKTKNKYIKIETNLNELSVTKCGTTFRFDLILTHISISKNFKNCE